MSTLTTAFAQWSTRPAEQRFWDLPELLAATRRVKDFAAESVVDMGDLRVEAQGSELAIMGKKGVPATVGHFAFGQLAARVKAPAAYLRGLPPTLAAQNINHGLKTVGNEGGTKANLLLHRDPPTVANQPSTFTLRAATSEKYSRVWNSELVERLMQVLPAGWRAPPARPVGGGRVGVERTRQATQEDVSRLSQHLSLAVRVGDTIAPAGLYASDKDMFMFLINEENPIDDGTGFPLYRGIMLWNSELGDMALGGQTFLLKGQCGNHIVHGASSVMEFNFRHVGNVHGRTNDALEVQIKKYAEKTASGEELPLLQAKAKVLGASKDEVIKAVMSFVAAKKVVGLNKALVDSAYDAAEAHSNWYGSPRTVYGMVNGLTEVSQKETHTDDRLAIDRAAGRVMTMAF